MNEAIVFFVISLIIFIAGMYLAAPLIGINMGGYSTSDITNNITVTTITRNKETYTITVPKNIRSSGYTGVEKLKIVNAYATGSGGTYTVHITIKNTGTKIATIDQVFVNNTPLTSTIALTSTSGSVSSTTSGITMYPGSQATLEFTISGSPGQTVSIVIHTASGGQYPATITLP